MDDKVLARAKNAAYRILTYRSRSRAELTQKLADKGHDEAVIEAVVEDLARLGYVDDRRFAEQWAEGRIRIRGYGRRRIEQELRNKGVSRDAIAGAVARVFSADTELETARGAALKKNNSMKSIDRETRRRRLAGFLERRGFPHDVIRDALKDIERA